MRFATQVAIIERTGKFLVNSAARLTLRVFTSLNGYGLHTTSKATGIDTSPLWYSAFNRLMPKT